MYSLQFRCRSEELDLLVAEVWEAGTIGLREIDQPDGFVLVIAGFEEEPSALTCRLKAYGARWREEETTDWVEHTKRVWPGREVGETLYLAPPWSEKETPTGRHRLVHTPGLACGTGEHPCTRLALVALENTMTPDCRVADIGSGSGVLTTAAFLLGALQVLALDTDEGVVNAARNDFRLNQVSPLVVVGSADAVAGSAFDITVANISGTVLLAILDDLLRITEPGGILILTGFSEDESARFEALLPGSRVLHLEGWSCVIAENWV